MSQDHVIELLRQFQAGAAITAEDEAFLQREGLVDVIGTYPVTVELTLRGKRMLRESETVQCDACDAEHLRMTVSAMKRHAADALKALAAGRTVDASGCLFALCALLPQPTDANLPLPEDFEGPALTAERAMEVVCGIVPKWAAGPDVLADAIADALLSAASGKPITSSDPLPNPLLVPLTRYADALDMVARQEGCGEATRTKLEGAALLVRGAARGGQGAGASLPTDYAARRAMGEGGHGLVTVTPEPAAERGEDAWTPPQYFQGIIGDDSTYAPSAWEIPENHPSRTLSAPTRPGVDHERLREAAQALCDAAEDAAEDDDADVSSDESDPDYIVPADRMNELRAALSAVPVAPARPGKDTRLAQIRAVLDAAPVYLDAQQTARLRAIVGDEPAPSEAERAQAERWARARYSRAWGPETGARPWEELPIGVREAEIAAMLPLVREAAADRDKWRQLAEFSEAEIERMRAEIERLRTPAPLTEEDHGPPEDEALRWAEDVLDAAKPPEEADLDMSAAAQAISPLVREAQAARRAPLTEANARAALDAAERAYLLAGGWTEVPPQNVMHEPRWTRAGRRYPTHRSQAIAIQRDMDADAGKNGDPK